MGRNGPPPTGEQTGSQAPMTPAPPPRKVLPILWEEADQYGPYFVPAFPPRRKPATWEEADAMWGTRRRPVTAEISPGVVPPTVVDFERPVSFFPTTHLHKPTEPTAESVALTNALIEETGRRWFGPQVEIEIRAENRLDALLDALRKAGQCGCVGLRHKPEAVYCRECGGKVRDDARLSDPHAQPSGQAGQITLSKAAPHRGLVGLIARVYAQARAFLR